MLVSNDSPQSFRQICIYICLKAAVCRQSQRKDIHYAVSLLNLIYRLDNNQFVVHISLDSFFFTFLFLLLYVCFHSIRTYKKLCFAIWFFCSTWHISAWILNKFIPSSLFIVAQIRLFYKGFVGHQYFLSINY